MKFKATRTVDYSEWARSLAGGIERTKLDIKRRSNNLSVCAARETTRDPLSLLKEQSMLSEYDIIMEISGTLDTLLATQDETRRNPSGFAYYINREGEYFRAPVKTCKESEPAVRIIYDLFTKH